MKILLNIIILLICTIIFISPTLSNTLVGYIGPDYAHEQPPVGPSVVLRINEGIIISDEINRRIHIFSDLTLKKVIISYTYPEKLRSISEINIGSNELWVNCTSGLSFIIDTSDQIKLFELNKPILSGKFRNKGVDLTLENVSLGLLKPSTTDRSIIDWSYIGKYMNNIIFFANETDNKDLSARIYEFKNNSFNLVTEFSWSLFDYVTKNPLHLSDNGKIYIISLRNKSWSHSLNDIIDASRSLFGSKTKRSLFFEDDKTNVRNELNSLIKFQTKLFDDSLIDAERRLLSDYSVIDKAMLKFADISLFSLRKPSGIKRETAVARALAYYKLPFFYRKRNDRELGHEGRQKPKNLIGKAGTWQSGFRYYWGGYMSIKRHQEGLIRGYVVGDIDTKKIIYSGIVGCDCSGGVSSWLGIRRHTTTDISDDPEDIFSSVKLKDMRPGDIFNKRQSHVRMLLNKIPTPRGYRFRVIESAKSFDGVCIKTYSASDLKGYKPFSYKKFLN